MKVGTIVRLETYCLNNPPNTLGVCYEVYNIGHIGYSIIFENGDYDGFDEIELNTFEIETIGFSKEISNYKFTNVMKLSNDFDNGYFNDVFKK